jgi:hypothetical protein
MATLCVNVGTETTRLVGLGYQTHLSETVSAIAKYSIREYVVGCASVTFKETQYSSVNNAPSVSLIYNDSS